MSCDMSGVQAWPGSVPRDMSGGCKHGKDPCPETCPGCKHGKDPCPETCPGCKHGKDPCPETCPGCASMSKDPCPETCPGCKDSKDPCPETCPGCKHGKDPCPETCPGCKHGTVPGTQNPTFARHLGTSACQNHEWEGQLSGVSTQRSRGLGTGTECVGTFTVPGTQNPPFVHHMRARISFGVTFSKILGSYHDFHVPRRVSRGMSRFGGCLRCANHGVIRSILDR